jgi:RimJ/RimL family protein N-acetyltransferase
MVDLNRKISSPMILTQNSRDQVFGLTSLRVAQNKDFQIGPICFQELPYFKWLVQTYISGFYPETEDTYTETLASPHVNHDRSWRSTVNRTVWSVRRQETPIGFFVASEKRGQNVKLGPIVISPEFRRSGFGTRVLDTLATHYSRLGHQKLYMTIPTSNFAVRALAVKGGFFPEARLRQHYSSSHDEWVFGKCLERSNYAALSSANQTLTQPIREYCDGLVSEPSGVSHKRMLRGLVSNLQERDSCRISDDNSERSCRVFYTDIATKHASIVSSPKRGGAVRLEIIDGTSPGILNLLDEVEDHYLGTMRKMYLLVSLSDTALQRQLVARNYSTEGRLVQPYNKDLVVLSKLRQ